MDDISQGILSWQGSSNISTIFYVTTAVRFDHIEDAILIILSRIQRPFFGMAYLIIIYLSRICMYKSKNVHFSNMVAKCKTESVKFRSFSLKL